MGKKRVTQLLEQLKTNQQMELQNAAAIFTVAQVAVNELQEKISPNIESTAVELPSAPVLLNKAELLRRYGSYKGCRRAAKEQGIKFSRTPSWERLAAGLSYVDAFQKLTKAYVETHPSPALNGMTIELKLE